MQIHRTILFPIIVAILVIATVLGLAWANAHFLPATLSQTDIALGWSASNAWLLNGTSPYDASVMKNAEQLVKFQTGGDQARFGDPAYINPLYSLIIFGPFGLMGYNLSRVIWLTFIQICFLLFIVVSLHVSGWKVSLRGSTLVILIFLLWYNGAKSILTGQYIIIPLLLMVSALWLIQNNQDVGAGFLLAFSTVKPDISFLLVFYITIWSLFTKRYRLFASIVASAAFLLAVSTLLFPGWFLQWFRILVVVPGKDLFRTALAQFAQSLPGVKTPLNIVLHASAIILLLFGWIRSFKQDGKLFLWTAMLTLAFTTLIGYRIDAAYGLALLPGLFLIFRVWQERWQPAGYIFSWIILILILVASWGIYFSGIRNSGVEPTFMIIFPPITVIIGLYWIRWWAVQSPLLPFEVLRDRYGL